MAITEIKIGGLGGQGVILTGHVIGQAAAIYDAKHATMTQAFGPEARGSACSSQVIISDERILFPYVTRPDILVVLSQDALVRFLPDLREGGTLLYEKDLVSLEGVERDMKAIGIPATRFAEELGKRQCTNTVMCGFFAAVSGVVSEKAMRESVKASVPERTVDLNLQAFEKGFAFGKDALP